MQIHTIDLAFGGVANTIASYLVEGTDGLVLVETGPSSTLANCLSSLKRIGFSPQDIKHVLVTHIHFDHAGAAGWWAAQGAQIYIHHVGAPFMIDPTKLLQSARRVYGDQLEAMWGEVRPIPEEQVTLLYDNDVIQVGDLHFRALDTPGHATHHHCFAIDDICFCGDAVGVRIPDSTFIALAGAPPQFDPVAWDTTLDRLRQQQFNALYPTHFGRVANAQDHIDRYRNVVWGSAELIRAHIRNDADSAELQQQFKEYHRARLLREEGSLAEKLWLTHDTVNPFAMSADGVALYWKRAARRQSS